MAYTPPFITETDEPPPWPDCTWAAALMLWLKATLGGVPATRAEREALRTASGDTVGGSNLNDVDRGLRARYGAAPLPRLSGTVDDFKKKLEAGNGALVQLMYGRLSAHFTRWDPKFAAKPYSGHAAYVERYDRAADRVWWMDPLGRGTYRGEWLPLTQLWGAMRALGGTYAMIALEGSRRTNDLMASWSTTIDEFPGIRNWVVKAGTRLIGYSWDAGNGAFATKVDQTFSRDSSASADAYVDIKQFPVASKAPHGRFLRVTNGTYAGLLISAGMVTLLDPPPPVDVASITTARDQALSTLAYQKGIATQARELLTKITG